MKLGYIEGEGLRPICREATIANLSGLTAKEKRHVGALVARRNYLTMKLQDMPKNRWGYEGVELSAVEWSIQIIQEYFDLINQEL